MRNTEGSSEAEQQEQTHLQEVTEDTALQDEAIINMLDRVLWKEIVSINAIQTLFAEEIAAQNITISCIRQKIKRDPLLSKEEPKLVYDSVRAEWRFKAKPADSCGNETASLPEEQEMIDNGVSRMFQVLEDYQQSSHSSDSVFPTETTGKS